ncbi:N-acetylmuramic acid 6-phosphate etherase [Actinomyces glycerinitolerans]|uniref:N-acetylmuramic acid 6-phosphate etherase n=1 Tax=Actinomyces glycerinitolerans TaxID=1892869 RepID=A0A1M4RZ64_9ACTO|nr:N-acetylmuramic acid 6-phosphate etherase [Actinomyces glycerinitolerans]SHE25219.1 sugar isomerase (sis) [Actinomyces glycerinitolerans]
MADLEAAAARDRQSQRLGITEQRNPASADLDRMSSLEIVTVMNKEDHKVADAVQQALPQIARAVDAVVAGLRSGGRLIYMGAGTSGRLGVLDAAECPPTFRTDPNLVVGLIAGGKGAMFTAVEGAEDSAELGVSDLNELQLTAQDVVIGVAASGRTPYVIGGLDRARELGATTISLACNTGARTSAHADIAIEIDNGPEVITGSSRLKAGTSQKLVLNMISTAAMVRMGKVYGNLMVDVAPNNTKLIERAERIVMAAAGCGREQARAALRAAGGHAKTAIVMVIRGVDAAQARRALDAADGFVRAAIEEPGATADPPRCAAALAERPSVQPDSIVFTQSDPVSPHGDTKE